MTKLLIDRAVLEQALEAFGTTATRRLTHADQWQREERAMQALRAVLEQAPRQPLTDEQINDHRLALAYDSEDLPDPWDFNQGVRTAERAHGIGGEA